MDSRSNILQFKLNTQAFKRQDAGTEEMHTLTLRGFIRGQDRSVNVCKLLCTHMGVGGGEGQRLSDKQELWVGRPAGLGGNMS